MMQTSSLGKETFRTRVRVLGINPTSGTVEFAFPAEDAAPVSWSAGSWFDNEDLNPSTGIYTAYAQTPTVGSGGAGATVNLAAGTFDVWVRVTTGAEIIIRKVDKLLVT